MPFLLFVKNLAATRATCKSHLIINREAGILRVFPIHDDYVVSDKHLNAKGWRQCKTVLLVVCFFPRSFILQDSWIWAQLVSFHSSCLDPPTCSDSHLMPNLHCFSITVVCYISHQ